MEENAQTTWSTRLSNDEIAVLYATYIACGGSVHSHVPSKAIYNKLRFQVRASMKRTLKRLLRYPERFVGTKPTHGGRTYFITMVGIDELRNLNLI